MKLTIKLLSDLCTYSGDTYNSVVDTDVVYDENGIPYIPAKRIKGCIREAAEEMAVASGVKYLMYAGSTIVKTHILDEDLQSNFLLSND